MSIPLVTLGYEKITVSSTAIGYTTTNLTTKVMKTLNRVEGENIRFRADGTDPTSTDGMPAIPNETFEIEGMPDLTKFRAIRQSGDATLHVFFMGEGS